MLVVDDDPTFVIVLQHLIESDAGFEVVGRASNGEHAYALAVSLQPDIVTMDIRMPVLDGIAAIRMITSSLPTVRIVVVSASAHDDAAALDAGAVASVPKQDVAYNLLDVLQALTRAG